MSEQEAFLRALAEQPDDDTLKLVYADWLDEHGDPRAQLFRQEVDAINILGRENVHGFTAARSLFGELPDEALRQIAAHPVPNEVLEKCKDDHFLVLSPGYSLLQLQQRAQEIDESRRRSDPVCDRISPSLAGIHKNTKREEGAPCYVLLPKTPFPDLFNLSFADQKQRLSDHYPDYRIMTAAEILCILLLHEYHTREHLLPSQYLRCSTVDTLGQHMVVGADAHPAGIQIYNDVETDLDDAHLPLFGLAACRKL
jgi:uncharacterized protein (TIGR02996 family)